MADMARREEWYRSIPVNPFPLVRYCYIGHTINFLELFGLGNAIPEFDAKRWGPISSSQAAYEFQTALVNPATEAQQECIGRLNAAWNDPYWLLT
jgi:hypothetical protein